MLGTNPVDVSALAEDLHLAIALGEYTPAGAVAYILHVCGPEVTEPEAHRIMRRADPGDMTNVYEAHPITGDLIPRYGLAREIWDHKHGKDRNRLVMPRLVTKWGDGIAQFATT